MYFCQMYLQLGDLPLYLSRSASEGGFKRMKDGYFKTQAVSPLVEEVKFWLTHKQARAFDALDGGGRCCNDT